MDPACQSGLVSIIVPTHNRAHFLPDCLKSVWAQAYRPLELIVVDDGSTDSTEQVLLQWRGEQKENDAVAFTYIRQEKAGANVARNRGLVASRGEFIQFLDSDDVLLPHKIASGVRYFTGQNTDFVYSEVGLCDSGLKPKSGRIGAPPHGTDSDITTYLWQTMGPLYRRVVTCAVGPWMESIFYADDWEYAARVKLLGYKGLFENKVGGLLRVYNRPERSSLPELLSEAEHSFAAFQSVTQMASRLGRLSEELRGRLGRRFFLVGLQFGRCGNSGLKRVALSRARDLGVSAGLLGFLAAASMRLNSPAVDRLTIKLIRSLQRLR
jgi:glycosyltransferase involved in cell wall biosynthesis